MFRLLSSSLKHKRCTTRWCTFSYLITRDGEHKYLQTNRRTKTAITDPPVVATISHAIEGVLVTESPTQPEPTGTAMCANSLASQPEERRKHTEHQRKMAAAKTYAIGPSGPKSAPIAAPNDAENAYEIIGMTTSVHPKIHETARYTDEQIPLLNVRRKKEYVNILSFPERKGPAKAGPISCSCRRVTFLKDAKMYLGERCLAEHAQYFHDHRLRALFRIWKRAHRKLRLMNHISLT